MILFTVIWIMTVLDDGNQTRENSFIYVSFLKFILVLLSLNWMLVLSDMNYRNYLHVNGSKWGTIVLECIDC